MAKTDDGYRVIFCLKDANGLKLAAVHDKLEDNGIKAMFEKKKGKWWYHKKFQTSVQWIENSGNGTITAIIRIDPEYDGMAIQTCGVLIEWMLRNEPNYVMSIITDKIEGMVQKPKK